MIIKRSRVTAKGKREVVVEMGLDEQLIAVNGRGYYSLGGQIEDVVGGHALLETRQVHWCPFEQKWVSQ